MHILAIESSCDDTAIAVYQVNFQSNQHASKGKLLGHVVYTQTDIHKDYGGVVPELASRDHIRKAMPLIKNLFKKLKLQFSDINLIAYTQGPGLLGALLIGATLAKSLSLALDIPSIGVHHLEGHILAPMLEDNPPNFPFVTLLVSGGHTQLIEVKQFGKYRLLGETLDDAAGEAFDKTAKLLNLDYPGGPAVAKLAQEGLGKNQNPFKFPRPMLDRPGLDMSFSGLKTAVLNSFLLEQKKSKFHSKSISHQTKANIARAFEEAVVSTLVKKSERALKQTQYSTLVLAGGVSANIYLRQKMGEMAQKNKFNLFYAQPEFCTDNAAMIALAGAMRYQKQGPDTDLSIRVKTRWLLENL